MTEANQNIYTLMAWSFLVNPEPADANDVARDLAKAFMTVNEENERLKQHRAELEEQIRILGEQKKQLLRRSEKTDHLVQIFDTNNTRYVGRPRVTITGIKNL